MTTGTVEERVLALAQQHKINAELLAMDHLGNAITHLAGDDVPLDTIETLLIHLGQQEHLTQTEVLHWSVEWCSEKRNREFYGL